jgi:hypothetical protein
MLGVDLLQDAFVLSGIGFVALGLFGGKKQQEQVEQQVAPEPDQRERDAIRIRNGVRRITAEEEGFATDQLPSGVYGFTYSPGSDAVPLFAKHCIEDFEVHKPEGREPQLLGYVTENDYAVIESGEAITTKLYPSAYEQATKLIAVPGERIVNVKHPSRIDGNYVVITISSVQ